MTPVTVFLTDVGITSGVSLDVTLVLVPLILVLQYIERTAVRDGDL